MFNTNVYPFVPFNTKIYTQSVALVPSSQFPDQDWYKSATLLNGEPAFNAEWAEFYPEWCEYTMNEPSYKMIDVGNVSTMAVNFTDVIYIIVTPEMLEKITDKALAQELKESAEKARYKISSDRTGYLTLKYSEDEYRDEYDNKHFTECLILRLNDQILRITHKYQQ